MVLPYIDMNPPRVYRRWEGGSCLGTHITFLRHDQNLSIVPNTSLWWFPLKKYLKVEDLNNLKPSTCNFVKMKFIRVSFQKVNSDLHLLQRGYISLRNHDSYVQFHSGGKLFPTEASLLILESEFQEACSSAVQNKPARWLCQGRHLQRMAEQIT